MTTSTAFECIGTLDEDVTTLASRIRQQAEDVPRLVWAEDDGRVYLGPLPEKEWVPEKWIAGIFVGSTPVSAIADDLRALQLERSTHSILGDF